MRLAKRFAAAVSRALLWLAVFFEPRPPVFSTKPARDAERAPTKPVDADLHYGEVIIVNGCVQAKALGQEGDTVYFQTSCPWFAQHTAPRSRCALRPNRFLGCAPWERN